MNYETLLQSWNVLYRVPDYSVCSVNKTGYCWKNRSHTFLEFAHIQSAQSSDGSVHQKIPRPIQESGKIQILPILNITYYRVLHAKSPMALFSMFIYIMHGTFAIPECETDIQV